MLLIAAMLEMTNGLKIGQELFSNQPTLLLVILATFLTSQSLSIHMQVAVIDKNRETVVKTITFSWDFAIPFLFQPFSTYYF